LALAGRNRFDEALTHYQKALEIKPDNAEVHNNLGLALAGHGQLDEALAQFGKAVDIKPGYAEAQYNLGAVLATRGKVDEAIVHFRKVLEIKPDYAMAHYNLGRSLAKRGEFDEALVHLSKAKEINPNDAEARRSVDGVLAQRERLMRTLAERRETLRSRPADLALLNDTAWVLATNPNPSIRNGAEAVELAQRAVQLAEGREPAVLDTLAAAYAETGQIPEALQTARKGLELATQQHKPSLAESIRAKLPLYEAGTPFRELRQSAPVDSARP
jgi:tetratricopeptide (TPR) repeat protein